MSYKLSDTGMRAKIRFTDLYELVNYILLLTICLCMCAWDGYYISSTTKYKIYFIYVFNLLKQVDLTTPQKLPQYYDK